MYLDIDQFEVCVLMQVVRVKFKHVKYQDLLTYWHFINNTQVLLTYTTIVNSYIILKIIIIT